MKRLLFILIIFNLQSIAQNHANIWYFGENAGLDFNSGSPVILTNGALNTSEGCATISNSNGGLLFYTDGVRVWNKNHIQMPNGFGLLGNSSTTQTLIVPKPGSDSIYYIFTASNSEIGLINGLNYSVVDISLLGGLGDVTTKNVFLHTPMCEKITAVKHCNNIDIWVITHKWNSDAFHAYLVTDTGINPMPIISNVGLIHFTPFVFLGAIGYLRASPLGCKLASAVYGGRFELFDFDNSTGIVSNPIELGSYPVNYGVEFSPDGTKVYTSYGALPSEIYQYDLQAGDSTAIINSATLIFSYSGPIFYYLSSALQLGPDGKIYVAHHTDTSLGVINNPNALGTACNYVNDGIFLAGKKSNWGLPNFVTSFLNNLKFTYKNTCYGDSTFFFISCTTNLDSLYWDFGDTASGALNFSTEINPFHIFSSPGNYNVKLIIYHCNTSDTASKIITILPSPQINLGNDSFICTGDSVILDAGNPGASYQWSTGETTQTITIDTAGTYWVEVDDSICVGNDTIVIAEDCDTTEPPIFFLPNSFSPNGDNNNDVLLVRGSGIKSIKLFIYNRWGEKVFETYDIKKDWDGTYRGKSLNPTVFAWYAEVEFINNELIYRKGNVTLIK